MVNYIDKPRSSDIAIPNVTDVQSVTQELPFLLSAIFFFQFKLGFNKNSVIFIHDFSYLYI